jgi:hypothetical protein
MLAASAATPACARDASSADSDWERVDSVLEIPPVYKPAARSSAPATADLPPDGSGCESQKLGSGADGAVAVAGTADTACAAAGSASDDRQVSSSDSGQRESDSADSPAAADPAIGTLDDYRQQQAAAEAAARAAIGQIPVVVGPPLVPYYLPRAYAAPAPAMNHLYVPSTGFANIAPRASWMPAPVTPMVVPPPAWAPQPTVPMVAAPAPMFIPRTFGSFGRSAGYGAAAGGWRR